MILQIESRQKYTATFCGIDLGLSIVLHIPEAGKSMVFCIDRSSVTSNLQLLLTNCKLEPSGS